jgi:tRNA isopentenyl-2-thiomethyl-A-37 hydroxylase MiaE
VRRLEKAGMSLDLAEVQAEVLNEAFTVNLESLVTKDYFESRSDTRFAEQKSYMDTRFAQQNAYIDTRFSEQKSYMDTRFAEQSASIDTRFAELSARVDGNFRVQNWILAIIVAAVLLPYLERILAL